jgi:hypothetical protein
MVQKIFTSRYFHSAIESFVLAGFGFCFPNFISWSKSVPYSSIRCRADLTLVRGTLKLRTNITGNYALESGKGEERMRGGEEDV